MKKFIPPNRSKVEAPAEGPRYGLPGMFLGLLLGGLVCGAVFWLMGIHWVWLGIPVAGWIGFVVSKDLLSPGRNPLPPNVLWSRAEKMEDFSRKP